MAVEINRNDALIIDNQPYPIVGYGTYPATGNECAKAVEAAIKAGYKIIDTATFYRNIEPIGDVVKRHGRQNFYIISKVWIDSLTPDKVREDFAKTLEQLQTDYLDAYLIHWPISKVPIDQTLKAMDELRLAGKIRHIGVSNFTINHLRKALECKVPITWNQVEMHPHFYDPELLGFCRQKSIVVQAWGPLARGRLSEDKLLKSLGEKHGKTPAQVAIRWIIQHGCVPLPGSKSPEHLRQNFDVMDFKLSDKEMKMIDDIAKGGERERYSWLDEFDYTYEECWPFKG